MKTALWITVGTLDALVISWYMAMTFNKKFRRRFVLWLDRVDSRRKETP